MVKLRKYRGRDAATLKKRILRELGEDAVIISARPVIEGGFLGFFGRSMIEIVAALPDENRTPGREGLQVDIAVPEEAPLNMGETGTGDSNAADGRIPHRVALDGINRESGARGPDEALADGDGDGRGAEKTRKAVTEGGMRSPARTWPRIGERREGQERERAAGEGQPPFVPLRFTAGINADEAGSLPRKAIVLGPSGCGKTTCLGRIAWALTGRGIRVRVLSLEEDGRLSGVRRWEELWKNMGIEYRACLGVEHLLREARGAAGAVLIDTPPLAPRKVAEWADFTRSELPAFEKVLVLEARMESREFEAWLRACEALEPYVLAITKADELFEGLKAERLADVAPVAEVYLARDPSIVVPMERYVSAALRPRASRRVETGAGEEDPEGIVI